MSHLSHKKGKTLSSKRKKKYVEGEGIGSRGNTLSEEGFL